MLRKCDLCGTNLDNVIGEHTSEKCRKKRWKNRNKESVNAWQREWFHRKNRIDWKDKKCFTCGKMFLPDIKHKTDGCYCSKECARKINRKVSVQNLRVKKYFSSLALPRTFSPLLVSEWKDILVSHNFSCALCGSKERIEMDHILPLYMGGDHKKDNIRALCHSCNNKLYQDSRRIKSQNCKRKITTL